MTSASTNGSLLPDPQPIHALMGGLIDYAGLFPPAKVSMEAAAANYAKYLASPEGWMLGRFILPVSRIEEFRKAAGAILPRKDEYESGGWLISALADGDLDENLDSIFAFNNQHAEAKNGLAVIDAVEIKVPPVSATDISPSLPFVEHALEIMAEGVYPFFELPVMGAKPGDKTPDLRGCIAALAGADAGAKVRTGGVTPEAIPSSRAVAEFIVACHAAEVPFKATAGLHHAIRSDQPLTYEPNCPRAVMHGFLNVFVAAAMILEYRIDAQAVTKILDETDPRKFVFTDETLSWGPGTLVMDHLEHARERFALSYGSCSFDEPVAELKALGLI